MGKFVVRIIRFSEHSYLLNNVFSVVKTTDLYPQAFTPLLGSLLGSLLGAQFRYETGPPYHTHATNGWHR